MSYKDIIIFTGAEGRRLYALDERIYFCIDMKTFYASVECAERGLNPFETNLVVADISRGRGALCLAVSPRMKALGVHNRCRLFEISDNIKYEAAPPRMALYIQYAADIYALYLRYFSPDDIHVYSIDECFIDATAYLRVYNTDARSLAAKLMNDIANELHIPSTAGIGTNLFLAKIALDLTAKHAPDHIGYLDEDIFKNTLWTHRPITDFWQIAKGTAKRLEKYGVRDLKSITETAPELLYREFGKDAELLIDHAWGRESCLMEDIKSYRGKSHSVSFSQILPRDYSFDEARTVLKEMVLNGCHELMKRKVITSSVWIGIGYSKDALPMTKGSENLASATASVSLIEASALRVYDLTADRSTPIRRICISFEKVCDEGCAGYDLFTDWEAVERESAREHAVLNIAEKYGKNSVLRGTSFLPEATLRERNMMIGGHRAGYDDASGKSKAVSAV